VRTLIKGPHAKRQIPFAVSLSARLSRCVNEIA
jgi:hypothetical protein